MFQGQVFAGVYEIFMTQILQLLSNWITICLSRLVLSHSRLWDIFMSSAMYRHQRLMSMVPEGSDGRKDTEKLHDWWPSRHIHLSLLRQSYQPKHIKSIKWRSSFWLQRHSFWALYSPPRFQLRKSKSHHRLSQITLQDMARSQRWEEWFFACSRTDHS